MDMESVSSQLLTRYSFDRPSDSPAESSRKGQRIDEHHAGHRARHVHSHEPGHDIEKRRDVEDQPDKYTHRDKDAGETGALSYRRSERTSLLVRTQEGDTVKLKIKASESLTVDTEKSDDDGEMISNIELQARSSTRISIKVKGDLNEQEMTAIQSVIDQAGTMAEDFFSGDVEDAFATASTLEIDATQLANVRIRMKSSGQLTYPMGAVLPTLVRSPEETTGEPVAGDEVTDNPESVAVATTAGEETISEAAATTAGTGDGELVDPSATETDGTAAIEESAAPDRNQVMANALQSIGVFLNNLLSTFGGGDDGAGDDFSNPDMTLKLQVFRSMLLSINDLENPAVEEPATALAADTIDAVTAQQSPLDAVA